MTHPIKEIKALGFVWETLDPFLFCVHHEDYFPKGNGNLGPDPEYLKGRILGEDFVIRDGFRMYHGKEVPGFPGHPHRGFETVTVVRKGLVDHADSLGMAGRYGNGDVQWVTAGKGLQHSEMFPLLKQNEPNPTELFQIWLNLPKKSKMVSPYFKMLWTEQIPRISVSAANGASVLVEVIAGHFNGIAAPAPPPDSWAADPANEVSILNLKLEAGASIEISGVSASTNRTIYIYKGDRITVSGKSVSTYHAAVLHASESVLIENGGTSEAGILMLQGKPIGEPVVQYGPFVMNSREEIMQAFEDFQRTEFGGWPWPRTDMVHGAERGRFARYADGTEEIK